MILSTLCATAVLATPSAGPVTLARVFTKGERAQYQIVSYLNAEQREQGLDTWMPSELELNYKFNYEVTAMQADGICVMRYKRPTMTEITGESADSLPVPRTTKVDYDLILTVSPINEILDFKEVPKPPAKPAAKPKPELIQVVRSMAGASAPKAQLQAFLGQFVGEIYRLALFVGSFDSSMDFAPPLPVEEVEVGDTWKKTVGFTPQVLKGKGGQMAVQRLDFTYTYKGLVDVNGKKFHRVEGDLKVKSDLGEFIHQTFNVKSNVTGLKEIPMEMTSKVLYDLDPKTFHTVRAQASSTGGFSVIATGNTGAVQEEKFKATSDLTLLNIKR